MGKFLTRLLIVLLAVGTVSGWAIALNLSFRVLPPIVATGTNGGPEGAVREFVVKHVDAEAGKATWEQVAAYATGPELEVIRAEQQANPAPIDGLALTGEPTLVVLWRDGPNAMVETRFEVTGTDVGTTPIGELMSVTLESGVWKVSGVWRVTIDPGTPIVPTPTAEPSPAG